MVELINETKSEIIKILNDDYALEKISSETLFRIVMKYGNDNEIREIIIKKSSMIINRCTIDYDMYNFFTIVALKIFNIEKEKANQCLEKTVKKCLVKRA